MPCMLKLPASMNARGLQTIEGTSRNERGNAFEFRALTRATWRLSSYMREEIPTSPGGAVLFLLPRHM